MMQVIIQSFLEHRFFLIKDLIKDSTIIFHQLFIWQVSGSKLTKPFEEFQSELNEKKYSINNYFSNLENFAKSNKDLASQLRDESEFFEMRIQKIGSVVREKVDKINNAIDDLKKYQNEFGKVLTELKRIDANLQVEHHATSNSALEKTLNEQLNVLKQVKYEIDQLSAKINYLNDLSKKYLLYSHSIDSNFQNKLKQELFDLNENFSKLKNTYANKKFNLEDILTKSSKVDSRVNDIENWISLKNNEILENDGVIITEEQFDQRNIKYKQIKSEIDRKSSE
ncbi:dystrophin, partial [Brachionus plicatilis]